MHSIHVGILKRSPQQQEEQQEEEHQQLKQAEYFWSENTCHDEYDEEDDAPYLLAQLEILAGFLYHLNEECEQVEQVGNDEKRLDGIISILVVAMPVVVAVTVVIPSAVVVLTKAPAMVNREAMVGNGNRVHVEGERCKNKACLAAIHGCWMTRFVLRECDAKLFSVPVFDKTYW